VSSVRAYLELARWQNCLIAAAGVLVGAWWAGWGPVGPIVTFALAAIAFAACANAFDDVHDVAIDRTVHPTRPIPSGRITPEHAQRFAFVAAIAAIVLATLADWSFLWAAVMIVFLMLVYAATLKPLGLVGNIAVAILGSLPFLFGAILAGDPRAGMQLVAIAVPMHVAREIAKDIDDVAGDRGRRRTVPIRWGLPAARALMVVALLLFAVQIIPVARALPLLAWLILPALLLAAIGAARSARGLPGAPRALKAAMLCTMLAFVIARI
jgi:geranylgeranylglycerol-phosphate geranylgeranyltransferase